MALTQTSARVAGVRTVHYADSQDRWLPAVMVLPFLLAITALVIIPLLWGIRISFTNSRIIGRAFTEAFTLANYQSILTDPDTWHSLYVTAVFSLGTVIGSIALGLVTALVLTRAFPGRGIVRTLIILPWAVPHVVAALIWQWMYNPNYGVVNYAIGWIPFVTTQPNWLSDPNLALPAIIILNIWKTYPFATLVLLAGLQSIPDELYEASEIDGAGPVRRFLDITLPGLKHVLAIVVLLLTIWSFGNFVFIFLMTQGGPAGATNTLVVKVYFEAFRFFRAGPAFAMGSLLLLVAVLLTLAYAFIVRRGNDA